MCPTAMLPEHAYAMATASLSKVGPAGLRRILRGRPPSMAWHQLMRGRHPADPQRRWRDESQRMDVGGLWKIHCQAGIRTVLYGQSEYPKALLDDDEPPEVLFFLGELSAADGPARVAVVGTRSATRYGMGVAAQLGAELTTAGVGVVSGLALGIDGAAHDAACTARAADRAHSAAPVAVVAGGLDTPYPRRNGALWRRLAETGVVISECPVGVGNETWRFPQRNRVIAALAHVIVVVECHALGGSLHTVSAADRRGRPVGAVPGSIRSPASSGTNGLLADGAFPVRDTSDVLTSLSLEGVELPYSRRGGRVTRTKSRQPSGFQETLSFGEETPDRSGETAEQGREHQRSQGPSDRRSQSSLGGSLASSIAERQIHKGDRPSVIDALEFEPASLDQLMRRTGLPLALLAQELERLAADDLAQEIGAGLWISSPKAT